MKNFKSISLVLLLISTLVYSSQNMARGGSKGVDLNLTDEQKTQMQAVKDKKNESMETARLEITNQAHAEMAIFLTAEQYEQLMVHYDEKQDHKTLRKEHRQIEKEARKAARGNN